jgi:phosphate starvation-inducible membrane PsiE
VLEPLPATKGKVKPTIVKKVHSSLLVFLLMNFTLGLVSDTKFSAKLVFAVKVITYLSGILLFFLSFKHRKLVTMYYSRFLERFREKAQITPKKGGRKRWI